MQFQDFRQNRNILNNTRRTALYLVSKSNIGLLKYTPMQRSDSFLFVEHIQGRTSIRSQPRVCALRGRTARTHECPGYFASLHSKQGIVSLAP